ncbi:MAG: tetratricopeptide repeat protein [Campylobacterota bacterium]|nr:tetratricopeptide repeat protein [Campylobacterota bacterium]
MIIGINNPWLIGIIGGAIGAVLAGIILYYLFEYRKGKITKKIQITSVNNADRLLDKNMTSDALAIYIETLKITSEKEDPNLYAHIKNNEGISYFNLGIVREKEENLTKAIRAYEEALKIYTVEKYPLYHRGVLSNLKRTKQEMKQ